MADKMAEALVECKFTPYGASWMSQCDSREVQWYAHAQRIHILQSLEDQELIIYHRVDQFQRRRPHFPRQPRKDPLNIPPQIHLPNLR